MLSSADPEASGPNVGGRCDDELMSLTTSPPATEVRPDQRLEALFEELAELSGQRNAIDGRIVDIVAGSMATGCGAPGARSVAALVAWKDRLLTDQCEHHHQRGSPP